jgi:hypothetical protein
MQNVRYFVQIVMNVEISGQILKNLKIYNFMKRSAVLFHADRRDKINSIFLQFLKAHRYKSIRKALTNR